MLEIVEDFRTDTYRAVYIVDCAEVVFVLHAFQKKSRTGSGNVFADLGLAEPDVELIKADLAHAIATVIQERKLTQTQSAALMGLKQPNISLLVRGQTEGYSAGRLIALLNRPGHDVIIAYREKPKSQPAGRTFGLLKGAGPTVDAPSLGTYQRAAKQRGITKGANRLATEKVRRPYAVAAKQSGRTVAAKRVAGAAPRRRVGGDQTHRGDPGDPPANALRR